jgi:hypothetical protein
MHEHRPALAWKEEGLIVPGEAIGNFRLGCEPHELIPADREGTIADYSLRFNVRVELEKNVLVDLSTGSERYQTAEGIRVGTPFADVVAALGEPPERRELDGEGMFDFKAAYPERGIDFLVYLDKVLHIGVFAPYA